MITNVMQAIGDDRVWHFAIGVLTSLSCSVVIPYEWAWSCAFGIGAAKEIYDIRSSGFDPVDLTATTLGGLVISVRF